MSRSRQAMPLRWASKQPAFRSRPVAGRKGVSPPCPLVGFPPTAFRSLAFRKARCACAHDSDGRFPTGGQKELYMCGRERDEYSFPRLSTKLRSCLFAGRIRVKFIGFSEKMLPFFFRFGAVFLPFRRFCLILRHCWMYVSPSDAGRHVYPTGRIEKDERKRKYIQRNGGGRPCRGGFPFYAVLGR